MLFERLPTLGIPVVLLQPYVRELEHYVRLVHAQVLSPMPATEVQRELAGSIRGNETVAKLATIAGSLTTLPETQRYEAFRQAIVNQLRMKDIEQLVHESFGDLLRSALVTNRVAMEA